MAFIQRFMSGRLAVADQLERLVRGMHNPFDDRLSAALGITATEALEIVAWMADVRIELRRHVFETGARAKAIQVETVEMLFSGPESYDEKLKTWRASKDYRKAEEVFRSYFFGKRYFNCIPLTRFVDRFGQERTDAFLNAFALRRGSVTGFRYFASPNPPNPAELAPSFFVKDRKGNELLSVPLHAMFYNALYDRFGLQLLDVDDVPSAVLALATGAFFVSEDGAPHETVYERTLSAAERRAWLPFLHAGGDSAELTRLVAFTGAVPALAVMGGTYVARRLWTFSPLLLVGVVALAAVLAMRVPRDRYRAGGQAILTTLSVLTTHVYEPHYEALERFRSALPPFPSWEDLVADLSRDAALARACLYRLARSRKSPMTARELADELPALGIGQAPQRVGKVLRRYECFFEPYRGIWQLGSAVRPVR
jgi:hypothetical protein